MTVLRIALEAVWTLGSLGSLWGVLQHWGRGPEAGGDEGREPHPPLPDAEPDSPAGWIMRP